VLLFKDNHYKSQLKADDTQRHLQNKQQVQQLEEDYCQQQQAEEDYRQHQKEEQYKVQVFQVSSVKYSK
jgi:hypothetical protein